VRGLRSTKRLQPLDEIELVIAQEADGKTVGSERSDDIGHLEIVGTTAPRFQLD